MKNVTEWLKSTVFESITLGAAIPIVGFAVGALSLSGIALVVPFDWASPVSWIGLVTVVAVKNFIYSATEPMVKKYLK